MRQRPRPPVLLAIAAMIVAAAAGPDGEGWTVLVGEGGGLDAWKSPAGRWIVAGDAKPNPDDPRRLADVPGDGAIVDRDGRTTNLVTRESFGDVEFHAEFLVPKGSNSGVKFEGLYEVQIADSWGKRDVTASDCGGIYPRAELLPKYHHIDKGYPPRVNASKAPGEWQALDVIFQAPRFDTDGKKTADARFVRVVLNGRVVHEDLSVPYPTGHAWHDKERPTGPILLQADHGPVAFRDVRLRPWKPSESGSR